MILFGGSSSNYFLGNDSGVGGNGSGINYFFYSGSINYFFYRIGCDFFGGLRALAGAGGESNGGYDSSSCDERLFHDFIKY